MTLHIPREFEKTLIIYTRNFLGEHGSTRDSRMAREKEVTSRVGMEKGLSFGLGC